MASPNDTRDENDPRPESQVVDAGAGKGTNDDFGLAPLIDPAATKLDRDGSKLDEEPDAQAPGGGTEEVEPAEISEGGEAEISLFDDPKGEAPAGSSRSAAEAAPEPDSPAPAPPEPAEGAGSDRHGDDSGAPSEEGEDSEQLTARDLAERRAAERRALKMHKREERQRRKATRPRMRKLRFLAVLLFLSALAVVSWVFGVMMAVAVDLPDLEARAQYDDAQNSELYDRSGNKLVTLTGNERRVLIESEDISPLIKSAVVSIEDERFYEHRGIDYLGLARALREDILAGGAVQGGSTITQQFVKTALEASDERTILQKLKESALAYQIERRWSKDKILTNYLNNIYFGNGAYGIEAAAKTYFGANHPGCGDPDQRCASQLRVEEAALLAGMIASPSAFDPIVNQDAALERRNIVLDKMRELGEIVMSDEEFEELKQISLPGRTTIEPPSEQSESPYFTEWLRQQIVDRYGAGQAFGGGLQIESTLDLELQQAAEGVVSSRLSGLGPTAAVVAIENGTGKVRAMVGGLDYETSAFNAATNGFRQPGSSFKPFTLLTALENGISADSTWASQPVEIPFETKITTKSGETKTVTDTFAPKNYDDNYLGSASLTTATTYSDNSVYAQVGMEVGPDKIVDMANRLGIQSKIEDNPAMILGGLERGVTPLEMAYAFSTIASGGQRISGTMASRGIGKGPVGIESVEDSEGELVEDNLGASGANEEIGEEVLDPAIAEQAKGILNTVVTSGTGENAAVSGDYVWGKTGTTDGNIDAWFVGANEELTVAVWVGYADGSTPMETEYGGLPVDGGTIPALIFSDVVSAWNEFQATRED